MNIRDTSGDTEGDRRSFLQLAALGAIGLAALSMFRGNGSRKSAKSIRSIPLPGNGSIFTPRKDDRLESWIKSGGK
jgi:hypothetical protein